MHQQGSRDSLRVDGRWREMLESGADLRVRGTRQNEIHEEKQCHVLRSAAESESLETRMPAARVFDLQLALMSAMEVRVGL